MCNTNKVEDEVHFTLSCPFYEDERTEFFNNINKDRNYSQAKQLKYLFEEYPRKLAKYVTNIWLKRKNILYR